MINEKLYECLVKLGADEDEARDAASETAKVCLMAKDIELVKLATETLDTKMDYLTDLVKEIHARVLSDNTEE
ncbi:hypothetical protein [Endozoicomonas atrinae]|uniref:hypothetical protein n=1 Tax=Endozoicomonas atrinae TaxID=1333660 RepID=UPI000824BF0A|nr:hypothetical protein [Endozoicomonas atrinae]